MKKLALGLVVLFAFAFAAVAADAPQISAPRNGTEWLKLSSTEKLYWSLGYAQGYAEGLDKIEVTSGSSSPCAAVATRTEKSTSTQGQVSGAELVSGLERFYAEPANTVIPLGSAIRIFLLQKNNMDQVAIQELIDTARVLGQQAASK
jgi:hypothetical protein